MIRLLRRQQPLFPELSGAQASECGRYRPLLWRQWDDGPTMVLIVFHASYALDVDSDQAIDHAISLAKSLGFGRVEIIAAFSARSDRKDFADSTNMRLWGEESPEHAVTDAILVERLNAMGPDDKLVCAWGHFKRKEKFRLTKIRQLISISGKTPHMLSNSENGRPFTVCKAALKCEIFPWPNPTKRL